MTAYNDSYLGHSSVGSPLGDPRVALKTTVMSPREVFIVTTKDKTNTTYDTPKATLIYPMKSVKFNVSIKLINPNYLKSKRVM